MPRQLEIADDLGPQQRDDVAEHAEPEAGEQLFGHRGAAEDMPLFQDERLQAGASEVGGADEPVVAAADDHRVVALGQAVLLDSAAGRPPYGEGSRASHAPAGRFRSIGRRLAEYTGGNKPTNRARPDFVPPTRIDDPQSNAASWRR